MEKDNKLFKKGKVFWMELMAEWQIEIRKI